jgi:hypothetical protein
MADPITKARAEIDRLESVVRQHDEAIAHYVALKAQSVDEIAQIKRFIQMYVRFSGDAGVADFHQAAKATVVTVTERLIRIAAQINREGRRARTEDILRIALDEGISIGGNDEQARKNSIAGMLSRSGQFDAKRGQGYWIKSLGIPPDGLNGGDFDPEVGPVETADRQNDAGAPPDQENAVDPSESTAFIISTSAPVP